MPPCAVTPLDLYASVSAGLEAARYAGDPVLIVNNVTAYLAWIGHGCTVPAWLLWLLGGCE